jgi:hypothetical protein
LGLSRGFIDKIIQILNREPWSSSVRVYIRCLEANILLIYSSIDESLPVFLVLQTPYQSEDELQKYLSRLAIYLEVHVIGTAAQSQAQGHGEDVDPIAVKELLTTCAVPNPEDPLIAVQEQDETNEGQVTFAWKLAIPLGLDFQFIDLQPL